MQQDAELKRQNGVVVENFIEGLPFYIKPFAGPRLRKEAASFLKIEFRQKGALLGIKADKFPSFAWTKLNGQFHHFKNTPKGDFQLRRWMENGLLYSEAKKSDALKKSQYRFSSDGMLKVTVTVHSRFLPEPLKLRYTYKKVN